ncbi:MAG: DUF1990 family protein [Amnibacterium sp.]
MTGPRRRTALHAPEPGLNYTAIGATVSPGVVSFPPPGFKAAELRHRVGSGERRFELAGRALMTWGALRAAGFAVQEIRAEPRSGSSRGAGPLFLEDGTPWITPGMTATLTGPDGLEGSGPVKVVSVIDEPGRIGYVYGSRPGSPSCAERLLLLEQEEDDTVWLTVRSIWQQQARLLAARAADARQRRLDERLVKALHPSNAA